MKRTTLVVFVSVLLITPLVYANHAVDGKWEASVETRRGTQQVTFTFKAEGDKLTGTVTTPRGDSEIEDGKVMENSLSFKQKLSFQGRSMTFSYSGTLEGDEINFTREVEEMGRKTEFTAKRAQ